MPTSSAMLATIRDPLIVERYCVYDEFAAGGMASVHFARLNGAHGFRRTVAVKRLLPRLTRDREFALALVDEARLASRVRHHNVVSILDVVQTSDELLLVMEYVHGESLAKLSGWSSDRREHIPLPVAVAIVIDALHGLHAAHEATDERGVALDLVHRDVSPQNILVGLDGITRIADFGVAKAAGRVQSTRDGTVKGKLAYMAPEQISGGEVSRRSDLFAMAVVLWEVLAGARLFAADNDAERVFKVMAAPIAPPSSRRAELPTALDAIALRGLERDPSRRYGSAREMALALERAAPSVRPSDIANWVERVVAGRLAQRESMLHAIERDDNEDASTATWQVRTPPEAATGKRMIRRADSAAHASSAPVDIETGTHRKRGGRGLLIGSSVIALLAMLGVIAWTLLPRTAATVPVRPSRVEASPLPPPPPPMAAAPPPEPSKPVKAEPAPANAKRRRGPTRKASAPVCDPPYSIDSAGRVLFKVECM